MKKAIITITLLLCAFPLSILGQERIITNPYVENCYQLDNVNLIITEVSVDEDFTYVFFDYTTSPNLKDGWISMSSKTTLTSKDSNISLTIEEWGIETQTLDELNFDRQYPVDADSKYSFYMVFPSLPSNIENISIRENIGQGEFYWNGIQMKTIDRILNSFATTKRDAILYDSNWKRITTIAKGNSVEILSRRRNFYWVKIRHLEGYIHRVDLIFEKVL